MKLMGIFRFEFAYQIRRPWPWLAFAALVLFSFQTTRVAIVPVTLPQDFILNSPFIIASVSVIGCLIWLLVASAMAGEAAARDVQTGMHPLIYTTPVRKAEYLGGRFFAAFLLNALVLLGVQAGSLLAAYVPGVDPEIIGPFRPGAYLAAYAFIALPNAFVATAVQFLFALLSGRAMVSYVGSILLFFFTVPVPVFLYFALGRQEVALLADPIGMFAIMNEMMTEWTIVEKNVRMITLEGTMLRNRLFWLGIAVVILAGIQLRFRFAHRSAAGLWSRLTRRIGRFRAAKAPTPKIAAPGRFPVSVPQVHRSFGFAINVRRVSAIARSSFRILATSLPGLFLLVVFPLFVVFVLLAESEQWGVPLLPRTGYILAKHLTASLTHFSDFRVIVPLLIVYLSGELIWRERDARISESVDTTPVPEWVFFLGKFLGLGLVLAVFMASLAVAGMLSQTIRGYYDFQIGLYLQILFGFQLPEYLLFAVLAFLVHVVVNQKHVALLVALVAYFCILFSPAFGIEHNLLVYGAGPGWSYTDMRGFGPSVGPWLWFRLYWAAWALLLALLARLFWVRGREPDFRARLQIARRRLAHTTVGIATAVALILGFGGFIFYNTNVLNEYITDDELVYRRAEYERRYGRYEGIPQPQRTATKLHIEIYPDRGAATIRGSYRLVNRNAAPIDSVHLEPAFFVDTRIAFDRAFSQALADDELGHHIYALEEPLRPGDSLTLSFEVEFEPRGFSNSGASMAIVGNGSYFTGRALPVIGYQPLRELMSADDRREYGLPRQVTLPPPGDVDPNVTAGGVGTFEAVLGTDGDQVAVAPGELRRTWSEAGRRYFHYASDIPIGGLYVFTSADYAVHREQWKGVELQVFTHPGHTNHRDRLLRSARASLDYCSAQFGRYPYPFLQIVEQPGNFFGMGVDGSGVITGGEGFFLLDPQHDGFDVIFEVVAHEMGHQWWGVQLNPAFAEGAIILSEGLAWYSAMQVIRHTNGPDELRRFRALMRQPHPWPPIRTGLPLLRAMDPWSGYRKAPFAFYALSEYIGEERVNGALRSLLQKEAGSPATTLDLYRELQAATPDSMQYLLHDLFAANTFWELSTEQVTTEQTGTGAWRVTLDVRARKVTTDTAGAETETPMNEWIEIGVYAPGEEGTTTPRPLYLQKHRIRSGRQTISVTTPEKPGSAGIDPRYLLLDLATNDNIAEVESE